MKSRVSVCYVNIEDGVSLCAADCQSADEVQVLLQVERTETHLSLEVSRLHPDHQSVSQASGLTDWRSSPLSYLTCCHSGQVALRETS